ncbi:hypothetical protein QJS04_geneDACA023975 [Acorus gramineus]|uniref:Uncharacterized protein n=1 Tax=Acorus gramineus TaxID=55184 RepID=A0AAV8ZYZ1_ACOGR|nr:hypothetical protein QJS04_geneDACA023975 [Acorus gramineus]
MLALDVENQKKSTSPEKAKNVQIPSSHHNLSIIYIIDGEKHLEAAPYQLVESFFPLLLLPLSPLQQ